jgi:hypothetical protein
MSSQVPTHDRRAAIISGEFVPLTVEEFRNGYATFSDGLDGKLPRDPDFPTEYHDAVTGAAKPVQDSRRGLADLRSRRNGCCGRCRCRRFMACGRSGN